MSTRSITAAHSVRTPAQPAPSWLTARPFWAGLSIISMWLAVLFVGVFGGNIDSTSASGATSSVPVVVVVAGVALVCTFVIGRRAFAASAVDDDVHKALEDERRAREELAADVSELRAGASG